MRNILVIGLFLGEHEDKIKEQLSLYIKKQGMDYDGILIKSSKEGLLEYAKKSMDNLTVVTNRMLQERAPYNIADLDELITCKSVKRIIFILADKFKRTDYIRDLYGIGLYDGLFVANESRYDLRDVFAVLGQPRDRADAKVYYGLDSIVPESVKRKLNEQVGQGIDLEEMIEYIENDKTGSIDERIAHVKSKVTSAEMLVIMRNLNENTKVNLIRKGGYETFYANEAQQYKAQEDTSAKIKTIVKEKTQYVTVNDAIGVISFVRDSGSTLVALNLARELADIDGLHPCLIQLPNTNSDVFERLGFNKEFGSGFIGHFNGVLRDGALPEDENIYCKVSFMVENPLLGDTSGWDDNSTLRLLNSAPSPKIIDLGSSWSNYDNLIPALKQLIVVIDDTKDIDEKYIRNLKGVQETYPSLKVSVVVNRCVDVHYSKAIKLINEEIRYVTLPVFSNQDMARVGNDILYPNIKGDIVCLAELAGYELPNVSSPEPPMVKVSEAKKRMLTEGTIEIGFGSVERGVGCTHTAIMLANMLKKSYKVAIVEQNDTKAIANLYSKFNPDSIIQQSFVKYFDYQGVDYFSLCDYGSFIANFKDDYDVVIADFGIVFQKDSNFLRMNKKIVCASASPWKITSLSRFYSDTRKRLDTNNNFIYAIPFLPNGELGSVRKICNGSEVIAVPVCNDVFNPSDDVEVVLGSILSNSDNKRKVKGFKGLFARK